MYANSHSDQFYTVSHLVVYCRRMFSSVVMEMYPDAVDVPLWQLCAPAQLIIRIPKICKLIQIKVKVYSLMVKGLLQQTTSRFYNKTAYCALIP